MPDAEHNADGPFILASADTGAGTPLPLALEGLPGVNDAGEPIHYRRMRVVPSGQWSDCKTGEALDLQKPRLDEWLRNTNALIGAGRKPFVTTKHIFGTPDARDTLGLVERVERVNDEFFAVVGLHGDESLKVAARNSRSIGVAGKDARDAQGNTYEGEWLHHLAICPNPALPGLGGMERIAASSGGVMVEVPVYSLAAAAAAAAPDPLPEVSSATFFAPSIPPLLLSLASDIAGFPVQSRAAAMLFLCACEEDAEDVAAEDHGEEDDDEGMIPASDPLAVYVRDIADRMALKDWSISISATTNANPSASASIRPVYGQKQATIWFCEEWGGFTAEKRRNDVVHELIHCHSAAVDSLVYEDLETQLAPAANELFQASFVRASEYQTDGLAAAIAPLMPLPGDDVVPPWGSATVASATAPDPLCFADSMLSPFGRALILAADAQGEWVTINGVHVLIKNGIITKGPKRFLGKTVEEAKAHRQSEKAQRASANAKYVGKDIQRYSEEHNEPALANGLKTGKQNAMSLRDNEPVDVVVTRGGKIKHGVELKTMTTGKNSKITMKGDALAKKKEWAKKNGAEFHTVVYDDRNVYNAKGKGKHDESKRVILYKRGGGSFRTGGMHHVEDAAELRRLMDTPNAQLPAAAQAPDGWKTKKVA